MIHTESQHQGAFVVGDKVPGASGALLAIHYKFVDFENSGHIERLALFGTTLPPPDGRRGRAGARRATRDESSRPPIDSGVKEDSTTTTTRLTSRWSTRSSRTRCRWRRARASSP